MSFDSNHVTNQIPSGAPASYNSPAPMPAQYKFNPNAQLDALKVTDPVDNPNLPDPPGSILSRTVDPFSFTTQ